MRHSFHSARILPYMRKPLISMVSATAMLFFYPMFAFTAPTNGLVVKGSANISQSGTATTIDQASTRAVIDWRGFNINSNELVRFNQPGASSVALNRVTGGDPTSILGQLSANGRVFITNPNGILFGAGAKIDVAGLVATTLSIDSDDFMSGRNLFTQELGKANSWVVNQGEIHIADNGFCFLVAPGVSNQGRIEAQLGKVVMASGKDLTLDFNGDGLMTYTVSGKVLESVIGPDGKPMSAGVENSGAISAKGGEVVLVGNAGGNVFSSVVNNSGVIEATALDVDGGTVILSGGDEGITQNSGTIDVSGKGAGQAGGVVEVLGEKVGLFDGTRIDASGEAGGGTVLVGGDYQGKNAGVLNASRAYVGIDAQINADAISYGDGGKVILWSNDGTQFYGNISARGGQLGGNGGFAEVSGKAYLDYEGFTDLRATHGTTGTLLLDPSEVTISTAANSNISGATPFTPSAASSNLNTVTLTSALGMSDVLVQTSGGGDGVITVAAGSPVSWSSPFGLTLGSWHDIIVNDAITNTGIGQIYLGAGHNVSLNASLSTAGNILLTADGGGSITQTSGTLTASKVTLSSSQGIGTFGAPVYIDTQTLDATITGAGYDMYIDATSALKNVTVNVKYDTGLANPANMSMTIAGGATFGYSAGTLITTGLTNVSLTENAVGIVIGTSSVGGTLSAKAAGKISQAPAATLSVTGASTFDAGAGNDIDLSNAGNNFGGAVTISSGKDVTLTDTDLMSLNTVSITGLLKADAGVASTLTLNNTINAGSVDLTGPSGIIINTSIMTTSGTQTYNDDVILGVGTTLTTTDSVVLFGSKVDSEATEGNGLTISAGSGAITLTGAVGSGVNQGLGALVLNSTNTTTLGGAVTSASVLTNAGGTTAINGGSVTTSGTQTYNDDVTLGVGTTLTTTNSAVLFGSKVDSEATEGNGLTISAGSGAITLTGAVGSGVTQGLGALVLNSTNTTTLGGAVTAASVLTNAGGTTAINGGSVTTSGTQTYNDDVTLGVGTTLTTT
ncbi:MAG: filamentous hemagglutinin N-terminal domain-containing protein, partial [Chlorobiaceae bacterium]|nr:filamentous hemagglutinin N-terminal domain-containing protein [Chlorobiaceae bacterium]